MFLGVILQRVQSAITPPSPKLQKIELPSDDEVQVVTEWLVPLPEDGKSAVTEGPSPPLHVPVIQRPADAKTPQDRDKVRVSFWFESPWGVSMLMSGVDVLWSLAIFILCE